MGTARIEGKIIINRPVDAVFDFVADERNEPRFNPQMRRVEQISPGPIGQGTRFRAETTSMGRSVEMVIEFTAYDRPGRLSSFTRMSAMDIRGTLTLDPVPEGTHALGMGDGAPRRTQAADPLDRSHGPAPGGDDLGQSQTVPGSS